MTRLGRDQKQEPLHKHILRLYVTWRSCPQNILDLPASVREDIYPNRAVRTAQSSSRSPGIFDTPALCVKTLNLLSAMAAMKTLFVVLMCLVAALAAFSSPAEAKGKVIKGYTNFK